MPAGVQKTCKVGTFEVKAVSDGVLNSTLNNFVGITPDDAERLLRMPAVGPVPLAVNAFFLGIAATHFLHLRSDFEDERLHPLRFELRWLAGKL